MERHSADYRGHRIEFVQREGARQQGDLVIDGEVVRFGQLIDGSYFLHDYAFDWHEDLLQVARRWIDHRIRARSIMQGASTNGAD
jgi:hypothetical protein